jgi:hypothetical protein
MIVLSTATIILIVGLLVVAGITAALAIGAAAEFVLTNRRTRLARHQSVRTYYRGFALTS